MSMLGRKDGPVAIDCFLKIDGIPGESHIKGREGEIELESFSWGETHQAPAGMGAGKLAIQDVHVTMQMNRASPLLMLAVASGQHLKSAVLTAAKNNQDVLVFTLADLTVSSFQTGASAVQTSLVDQVSFSFGKIEMAYHPRREDGTLEAPVIVSWDVKANHRM